MSTDTTEIGPPLSERVRDILRERIIRGHYPQGSRIVEARLAEDLDVSRIPLRVAIPQLQVSGLVHTLPRRGAVVFEWTPEAVNDLIDARLAIEVAAAGYAAMRAGSITAEVENLLELIEYTETPHRRGDPYEIALVTTRLHEAFVELAGNDLLTSAMKVVEARLTWLFYLTPTHDHDWAESAHVTLVHAITAGNVDYARALMHAHIEGAREIALNAVAALEPAQHHGFGRRS